jgi:hypothetical protein
MSAKFSERDIALTVTNSKSALPPWESDFEFYGTEPELRAHVIRDANQIEVRYRYTAFQQREGAPGKFGWLIWRIL